MPSVRTLSTADADELTALYKDYEWWGDRDVAEVRQALAETEVAIGVEDDNELVGAARVLTDYTYYGTIFDVIVAADQRGEGIGKTLMEALIEHPDLQEILSLSLFCRRGLVPFYESVGFELVGPEMEVPEGGTEELVRMSHTQTE